MVLRTRDYDCDCVIIDARLRNKKKSTTTFSIPRNIAKQKPANK